ncbi:HK97 gp10 family phage protein [Tissierella sp.]|uniref:HK97 gp10 family phage protein n=1 Tax=Tissierella sp. TaxID=41274 RepID=UPI0028A7838D|nr:HK97 gp10 family phage protein [Tissierella sp.]
MTKGITIEEAKKQMHDKVLRAMKEVGMELEAEIKLVTPVDTGALRRSITNKTEDKGDTIETEVGSYGIEYAYIVDQRVPYLESTVDSNLENIRRKMGEVLSK